MENSWMHAPASNHDLVQSTPTPSNHLSRPKKRPKKGNFLIIFHRFFDDFLGRFQEFSRYYVGIFGKLEPWIFKILVSGAWRRQKPGFGRLKAPWIGSLYKGQKDTFFSIFFGRFSIYLAASAAKYCEKGWGRFEKGGKPILELLGFLDFREISSRDQVGC